MSETNVAVTSAVEPSAENQRVLTYAQAGVKAFVKRCGAIRTSSI